MGYTTWSASTYDAAASMRAVNHVSDFAYSDSGARVTHTEMDVSRGGLDGKGAIREARDSTEHPLSVPIAIWLDETGSMSEVPRKVIKKLPSLFGLLLRKGYVTDPQIMFAGIGDAYSDRCPLQVGQFEAGNEADEDLARLVLEGNGGGGAHESYELALYFLSRRTRTDAWDKRGRRGYAFLIADEMAYDKVSRSQVSKLIGADEEADIPFDDILAEAQEKWDIYYIMPEGSMYARGSWAAEQGEKNFAFWSSRIGQNAIKLDDLDNLCEVIAVTIGIAEGTTTLSASLADLTEIGSPAGGTVSKSLATIGASAGPGDTVVAAPHGEMDLPDGSERL